jgi:lipopolysaccharide biosynthesis glycosyltransferase
MRKSFAASSPAANLRLLMRIVLTSNQEYFPGLCLTVASVLAFWKHETPPLFSVLTSRVPEDLLGKLESMVVERGARVEFHEVKGNELASLPPAPGLHPLTYARLLIPGLFPGEKVLYLDSDLLIVRDLSSLFSLELAGALAAAPQAGRLGDDCPWWEKDGLNPDAPYFCPGVMVIDCPAWLRERVGERTLELVLADPAACKCWDQTALNYILYGRYHVLSSAWSRLHWEFAKKPEEETFILHFITAGKPWRAPSDAGPHGVWLEAFEILCGRDFPGLSRKLTFLARRRVGEHLFARGVLALLSCWPGVSEKQKDHWRWKVSSTCSPEKRPEAGACRRLVEMVRVAARGS